MIGDTSANFDVLSLSEAELVDQACDRFETAWRGGDWPCIDGYLDAVAESCRLTLLYELIKLELELRMKMGELPTAEEYRLRFPDGAHAVDEIFREVLAPGEARSTLPDNILGSAVPNPDAPTLDAPTVDLDPGKIAELPTVDGALGRLFGDYVILDRLGSGGMGVVYRSFQRKADRLVALKLIKADWCGDSTELTNEKAEKHFRNEAQLLGGLEHDNIVPLYDVGQADGVLFFSMRLIKGRSLGQMVLSDGPLPARRAAYYMEAIARAIQYAHENKVMHRDVKPGNIMVDENDRPYLIDLGLARSLEATDYTTMTGRPLGTAAYMSPEQARGASKVGFGTDVYGLGATLFTLLTGRPPFTGPDPLVVLRKVIDEEPAWPRERDKPVGAELKAICLRCLEKTPGKRFASAGELAMVLKKYLNYETTGVTLPRPWTRPAKWVRRQPWRAAAASLACLAFLIMGSAWAWNVYKSRATADVFVHDLQTVSMANLPKKIEQMAGYRFWVNPRLHKLLKDKPGDLDLRTRVAMALLPTEPKWFDELSDRMLTCAPEEHVVIGEALRDYRQALFPKLRQVLNEPSADPGRRTHAAAALIALNTPDASSRWIADSAWAELRLAPDPDARIELLNWLVQSRIDPARLAARLDLEPEISVRRQVIQALGALGDGQTPAGLSAELADKLLAQYRDDRDSGIHSSLAYLFRRWGMDSQVKRIDKELEGKPRGNRNWYVNSAGLTMIIIEVPESHRALSTGPGQLPARFAIAATETPLSLFQESDPQHAERRMREYDLKPTTVADTPADAISYFDAARFCNWLSRREGIPAAHWCYRPGKVPGVMILETDYVKRRGYRLPTMAEWEFAARAGTASERYYGRDPALADGYAWHRLNSGNHARLVARLRPNDFGLFDVIGNMMEWCHNPVPSFYGDCPTCPPGPVAGSCELRLEAVKGGDFTNPPEHQTVSNQRRRFKFDTMQPEASVFFFGFRVAKNDL